jgi:fatty acid/phospholipid biosynthesis enzyme
MEDEPVRAIKRKKDSSMVRMAEAVKSGEADGFSFNGTYRLIFHLNFF